MIFSYSQFIVLSRVGKFFFEKQGYPFYFLCLFCGAWIYFLSPRSFPLELFWLIVFLLIPRVFWSIKFFLFGFLWSFFYGSFLVPGVPLVSSIETCLGGVVGKIEYRGGKKRILFQDFFSVSQENQALQGLKGKKIRLTLEASDVNALYKGMKIQGCFKVFPPSEALFEGMYDFQRYAWFYNLSGVGYFTRPVRILDSSKDFDFFDVFADLRINILKNLREFIPQEDIFSLAGALVVGEKGLIDEKIYQKYQRTGTAHILVISGLHVSFWALLSYGILRWLLFLLWPRGHYYVDTYKIVWIGTFFSVFFYVLLAGGTVPTQRAFVMISFGILAVLLNRRFFSYRILCYAAGILFVMNPHVLLELGFQLSFIAVAGLLWSLGWMQSYGRSIFGGVPIVFYFVGVVFSAGVITCLTLPLIVYVFHEIPVYSVLANIFVAPLMSFVIMPSILLYLVGYFLGLGDVFLPFLVSGIQFLFQGIEFFETLPGSYYVMEWIPFFTVITVMVGLLIGIVFSSRGFRAIGLCLVGLGLIYFLMDRPADIQLNWSRNLVVLRQDEGNMILWSTKNHYWQRRLKRDLGAHIPPCNTQQVCKFVMAGYRVEIYGPGYGRFVKGHQDPLAIHCERKKIIISYSKDFLPIYNGSLCAGIFEKKNRFSTSLTLRLFQDTFSIAHFFRNRSWHGGEVFE